jgi:hypothetical protein
MSYKPERRKPTPDRALLGARDWVESVTFTGMKKGDVTSVVMANSAGSQQHRLRQPRRCPGPGHQTDECHDQRENCTWRRSRNSNRCERRGVGALLVVAHGCAGWRERLAEGNRGRKPAGATNLRASCGGLSRLPVAQSGCGEDSTTFTSLRLRYCWEAAGGVFSRRLVRYHRHGARVG